PVVVEHRRPDVDLHVRPGQTVHSGEERARLADVRGQRAALGQLVAEQAGRGRGVDEVGRATGGPGDPARRVVVQVLADAGQCGDDVDAVLAQVLGRADAGDHQQ